MATTPHARVAATHLRLATRDGSALLAQDELPARRRRQRRPMPATDPAIVSIIRMIDATAERLPALVDRLARAIAEDDTLVLRPLARELAIETRFLAAQSNNLRHFTAEG